MRDTLTSRQRETAERVDAYRAKHGGTLLNACRQLGLNTATYGNARRRLLYGRAARWERGYLQPKMSAGVASDREAFE